MKTRTVVSTLALCFVAASVCLAGSAQMEKQMGSKMSPQMGTWKLNEAKSKFAPGATKNTTVVYEAAGDNTKVTVDGTDAKGAAVHSEWTGMFDGKDYAVTGDSTEDTRSYTKVNAHTLTLTNKKGGKVTSTGRAVVSADGKIRTVTLTTTDAMGKKQTSTAVYDKQ
jgi:hypothetical protein